MVHAFGPFRQNTGQGQVSGGPKASRGQRPPESSRGLRKAPENIELRLNRVATASFGLKLCEDVADDAGRPSMPLKVKKKEISPKPESNQRPKDYYFAFSPMFGS